MALRPSSCRVCMSFSTKDLRGSNSCSSGSHGGPFTTTLTPWKYLSRPSVSTMRCVELLTWRHLEPGLALELEDTQKAAVKSRRKRTTFFSALDCVGGAPLAPGSVPIRNGTKLGDLTPCIRQNIFPSSFVMSTVLKPLSLLLLRTSALRTPNWIRPITQSVGTEPSWCRRRHLAIRRINSGSNTTVLLQEHASGDEDSAGELNLSDSCVKVHTLGPMVFNLSSRSP